MAYDLITIADVRAEGLSSGDAGDPRVTLAIRLAGDLIRCVTRQQFFPVTYTTDQPLLLDGTGTSTLTLPAPVLALTGVAEDTVPLALDELAVYSGRSPDDDRFYPRLVKKGSSSPRFMSLYSYGRMQAGTWFRDAQIVALAGTFGFLDGNWRGAYDATATYAADDVVDYQGQTYLALQGVLHAVTPGSDTTKWQTGAAPAAIRRCAIDLVLREYRLKTDPEYADAVRKARPQREVTDRHSYELAGLVATGLWTGDPNIDDVLAMFKRRGGGTTGAPSP